MTKIPPVTVMESNGKKEENGTLPQLNGNNGDNGHVDLERLSELLAKGLTGARILQNVVGGVAGAVGSLALPSP